MRIVDTLGQRLLPKYTCILPPVRAVINRWEIEGLCRGTMNEDLQQDP